MRRKQICFGTGLVALDVILNGNPETLPKISVGGSCGNVLSILSFLGWESFPIARLANNNATNEILLDLDRWGIKRDYLFINEQGSTPIIIHRILKNKMGAAFHRFEFRNPETKEWLPGFKPITINVANHIIEQQIMPTVFYFDRMSPGVFELASYLKSKGTLIFFEPSSNKDEKLFDKFIRVTDILKFSSERIPDYKKRYPESDILLEVETLGEEGLAYRCNRGRRKEEWKNVKGFKLPFVQDAAGAGDWCSAGIISKIIVKRRDELLTLDESNIREALNYGQLLGALNCLYDGVRGLMYHHSRQSLYTLIKKLIPLAKDLNVTVKQSPSINTSKQIKLSDLY